ncbi:MAG: tetratricopeptide repeat protein [Bacteroidia bacterium]
MNAINVFAENEKDSLESILPYAPEKERVDILNGLAQLIRSSDTTKAASYARQALALSNKLNYCRGKATSTIIIGILNKNKSNYNQAKKHYLEGLALALKCKEPYSVSLAYHSLGNLALIKGDYNIALRYYIASLRLGEQLNDYRRIAKTLTNIATLYFELEQFDKSEDYYLRALRINSDLKDELTVAEISNNLGNIYLAKDYQLKALYHYSNALEVFRRLGSIYDISSVLNNIGVIYQHRNQHARAKPYFLESFYLDIKSNDKKAFAAVATNLSVVYNKLGNNDSAIYYANLAIKISKENNFLPELAEAYHQAALVYKSMGRKDKALEYEKLSDKITTDISGLEKQLEVNSLQNKYEVEKREIELKLLAKENEIKQLKIEEQNAQIYTNNIIIVSAAVVVFFLLLIIILFIILLSERKKYKEVELNHSTKTNLLNRINHELRTPLNSILGMSQLSMESKNFSELKDYLLHIKLSTDELTYILNNIISYLQLSNKQANPQKVPFHFIDMLQEQFKVFSAQCKSKGILFSHTILHQVPSDVIADKIKIQTIINNLFYNALKQTDKGVVSIEVKEAARKTNNGKTFSTIQITVNDEGEGLTETQIKNLFKNASKPKEFGLGLGLLLVKEFSKLLNAHITVTSELGKGSSFLFELDVEVFEKENHSNQKEFNPQKNITVLIVEDNVLNQKLLTKILERENIQYQIASNGKEALEKISEKTYDAMLLDLSLPVINGFEVAYKIRNEEEFESDKNIPIIAISANEDMNEYKKCIEIGINEYISKPINKELLIKYLLKLTS